MSHLYYILRLVFRRKTPLRPINKVQKPSETYLDELNNVSEKEELQFDIYGNPYIDDVFYLE
jgi:hypothetical protein